ncbi:MAG: hypothetical protein ACOX0C_01175 [Patescibacteria group bacterium]|jgi:hypothetical protein
MKKIFLLSFLAIGTIFFLTACSSPSSEQTLPNEEVAETESIITCTSPSEEGCESCLRVDGEGEACALLSWSGGEDAEVEPWYNMTETAECGTDAPLCDSCLKRDQSELAELMENPNFQECDCEAVDWENQIDACFMPMSCECLCGRYDRLSTACPVE